MKTYEKIYLILSQAQDYVSGEKLAQTLQLSRTSVWKAIQQLESRGLTISSVRNLGYRLESGDLLLPDYLAEELPFKIVYTENSSSTQTDARRGIEIGQDGPCLYLAPSQTAAKGRFGREFYTPAQGGIYMSLHLKPQLPLSEAPHYTLLTAASIVKAIQELTGKKTQIKWVNDIYLEGKKIAGILTEAVTSVETGLLTDIIIGVGFNFDITDFPDNLSSKVSSLFTEKPSITRNQLIAAIWSTFLSIPEEDLLKLYRQYSLVLGQTVSFTQNQTDYSGLAADIDKAGRLLIQLDSGGEMWLSSGEISLTEWG